MDLGLEGMVAFVTGASGGIGAALVQAFLGEKARVVACSRRGVDESTDVTSVLADVRDASAVDAAFAEGARRFGRIDVCVANAGIWPAATEPCDVQSETRVRDVVETNLLGSMWTARAFMRALRVSGPRADGRGASLAFIGSTAGRFGEPGHSEYAATKSALVGLTRTLKNEIAAIDPRARVNLVEPGWTVTPMAAEALEREGTSDRVTKTMALRQLATPEDVARAVLFFASPLAARHLTGESMLVAGGMEGRMLW